MAVRSILAVAAAGGVALAAPAAAQTYIVDPGSIFTASAVSDAMFGSQLVGMTVEVRFSDGTTSGGVWGFLGVGGNGPRYGVANDLFSFSALGEQDTGGPSTSLNDFNLSNFNFSEATIVGVLLHGAPAGAVFDRSLGGALGTLGSGAGRDVRKADPDEDDNEFLLTVTYRDLVSLGGAPPVGDLFATLDIAIGNPLPQGETYSFFLDTDVARNLTTVPEPATVVLFGAGLLGLVGVSAVRRRGADRG